MNEHQTPRDHRKCFRAEAFDKKIPIWISKAENHNVISISEWSGKDS